MFFNSIPYFYHTWVGLTSEVSKLLFFTCCIVIQVSVSAWFLNFLFAAFIRERRNSKEMIRLKLRKWSHSGAGHAWIFLFHLNHNPLLWVHTLLPHSFISASVMPSSILMSQWSNFLGNFQLPYIGETFQRTFASSQSFSFQILANLV